MTNRDRLIMRLSAAYLISAAATATGIRASSMMLAARELRRMLAEAR